MRHLIVHAQKPVRCRVNVSLHPRPEYRCQASRTAPATSPENVARKFSYVLPSWIGRTNIMSTTKFQIEESLMITTGIHISNAVLAKLASAIADLHRRTADMSMADWRKAYRERSGPTLGCFVYVDFTASGTVKGFTARQIETSREKFRDQGFEADVPMLGPSHFAAVSRPRLRRVPPAPGNYTARQCDPA